MSTEERHGSPPPILIVSGGVGTSGEQLVNTVLAQFPDIAVPVVIIPNVRHAAQIESAIAQAQELGGTIVHTLVDAGLRQTMIDSAQARGVASMDIMGPLLDRLTVVLGQAPLGQPGYYRQLHRTYFERVTAIEYTLAHDDGRNRQDWPAADVVLIGVSRTGKTPLSVYLSVLGWKVANLPLVPEIPTPRELYDLEPSHVIGLTIDLDRLLAFRLQRVKLMHMPAHSAYTHPTQIEDELRAARSIFRRGGFHVINVTDKPVEASADEVIRRIS